MRNGEAGDKRRQAVETLVSSVETLEVLLFLMSNPDAEWTADQISLNVRLSPESLLTALARLRAAEVVSATQAGLYRFAPVSPELANDVAVILKAALRERREPLIHLITTRPLGNIRVFADAFRIRKNED